MGRMAAIVPELNRLLVTQRWESRLEIHMTNDRGELGGFGRKRKGEETTSKDE